MGTVFGRKSQPSRVTEQDKAILQLKQQRDKLKQYQKRITLQLEKERLLAKQLLKDGRKEKALLLLKKKRYQDQLLDKTENQVSTLELMVHDIEFMQIEIRVIEGLKVGNECLKSMHEIMSMEDVERILDETQESVEYQRHIDEMLAGALTQEDEDAVLAELDAITQVCTGLNALLLPFSRSHVGQVAEDISCSPAQGVQGRGNHSEGRLLEG
ncbi:hypothetical protein fugu_014948 [Takifugu bimaculatus]|uniref:Charged multivesicular body protein 6 n=1 Tax=Takifugu bimaculatus TaxID=433685 RepID=A0A4Z2BXL6_9TELE|nr:hypothetical protein fugu_014948 [Takifugu bimaculatus]